MNKLLLVLLPIALAALWLAWAAWRGRLPPRPVLNAWFSLLLLLYLLATAGLGIFWVANQHLPVFDWHYVFGYALLLLLAVHLAFNLRALLHHLRRGQGGAVAQRPAVNSAPARRPLLGGLGALGLLGVGTAAGLGYFVGLRHGRTELRIEAVHLPAQALADAVVQEFHAFSSHTRGGLLRRAPTDWGAPPPPFKPAGSGPALPLARPQPDSPAPQGWGVAALADLLWHTAGINARSGGVSFRTAPSSGALFATELYVLPVDLPGLAAGVWHYEPAQQALRLHAAAGGPALAAEGSAEWPAGTLALVLATAVFRRSGHKYRDRTYRYVLCDLGHALENLRSCAVAAGLRATLLQAFDERRIAQALGLDEDEEAPLALMLLQRQAAPALPLLAPQAWQVPQLAGPGQPPGALGLTNAVHRASSLRQLAATQVGYSPPQRAAQPETAPGSPAAAAATQVLPSAALPPSDPRSLLATRRSVRRYANRPLALEDLAALLARMALPGPQLSAALHVNLLALQVQGLAAGAWRYRATDQTLHRSPPLQAEPSLATLRRSARAAGLDQDVIGDAAAVVVLSADRATLAVEPLGTARGYRHAFIEAGLMGERLYIEAAARGLGVCAVGAFYDDEAAALLGLSLQREWVLHFAALGVPG